MQQQWQTVFDINAAPTGKKADTVFMTGWNEWIAIKFKDGGKDPIHFVDLFNMEYSRDMEMMRGGYGDNYYLQMTDNVRRFKTTLRKRFVKPVSTVSLDSTAEAWQNVRAYPDFAGDALARNFKAYNAGLPPMTDNTNRNDITAVRMAHDMANLYIRVTTLNDVTEYQSGDTKWMNIWLGKGMGFNYDYVINREYGKLSAVTAGGYTTAGDVQMRVSENTLTVAVPLSLLSLSSDDIGLRFKVSDNVDASDRMNFYIQGDSAPMGQLSYSYGYIGDK